MRMNENVDPGMKGMEYRDCAKGAHMTPRDESTWQEAENAGDTRDATEGPTRHFELVDDGTLDTVLRCMECKEYERFNSESLLPEDEEIDALGDSVDGIRVDCAIELAEELHECVFFCNNCKTEAVKRTEKGLLLCFTCAEAYSWGMALPDGNLTNID